MRSIGEIVSFLQRLAPLDLAADWDNVGLLLGNPSKPVHRIMTCLTATPESVSEAVARRAELILSHHPVLFRPVQKLTGASVEGRMLLDLLGAEIALYSAHTAWDNAPEGINATLARLLGLEKVTPLRAGVGRSQCKIVVFVPETDLARVADALFAARAGEIGAYSQCSFRTAGTGTFFGSESSTPALGQKGRREEVPEWRLEVVCPSDRVARAVEAIRQAHSYEEPAIDVYALQASAPFLGEGRLGELAPPAKLEDLCRKVKTVLKAPAIQLVGEPSREIRRIAIACGAGGSLLVDAIARGADAFLTGEVRFHDALRAKAEGVALILPGHFATERIGMEHLSEKLQQEFRDLEAWASVKETDPFQAVTQS